MIQGCIASIRWPLLIAGMFLFLSRVESVPGQEAEGAVTRDRAPSIRGSTVAGGFTIEVRGIGTLDGMNALLDFRPDPKIQNGLGNTLGSATTNIATQSQTLGNQNGADGNAGGAGNAAATGGGAAFSGTGGATYGGSGIPANVGIAIHIASEKRNAQEKRQFVELSPKIKVTAVDASVDQSADTRPLRFTYPQFEKQFPGTHAAYVHRPRGVEPSIKKIEGELLITPGRKLEASFTDTKPQKKKIDGEWFQLHQVETTDQGIQVQITFPEPMRMKKASNVLEKFQAFAQSLGDFQVLLVDYDGNVYLPRGKTGTGGASGGVQGFSLNGATQTRRDASQEPSLTKMNFQFLPLPAGAEITKIVAVMTERDGEPQAVPFALDIEKDK